MEQIVLATGNKGKIREFSEAFSHLSIDCVPVKEVISLEEPEETGTTFMENALLKARYYAKATNRPCLADDSGLTVDVLDGAPGVYSARYAGPGHDSEANMNKLLQEMNNIKNRKACFRTVIALLLNGQEYLFEGIVNGQITKDKRGASGFGYDPIFVPDNYTQTFAEMGNDIKNTISHRAEAVKKLSAFLSTLSE